MAVKKQTKKSAARSFWFDVYYDYTAKRCRLSKTPASKIEEINPEHFGWYPSSAQALDGLQSIIDKDLREAEAEHARISRAIARARKEKG